MPLTTSRFRTVQAKRGYFLNYNSTGFGSLIHDHHGSVHIAFIGIIELSSSPEHMLRLLLFVRGRASFRACPWRGEGEGEGKNERKLQRDDEMFSHFLASHFYC